MRKVLIFCPFILNRPNINIAVLSNFNFLKWTPYHARKPLFVRAPAQWLMEVQPWKYHLAVNSCYQHSGECTEPCKIKAKDLFSSKKPNRTPESCVRYRLCIIISGMLFTSCLKVISSKSADTLHQKTSQKTASTHLANIANTGKEF